MNPMTPNRIALGLLVAAAACLPATAQEDDAPLWSQADAYFDAEEMAAAREAVLKEHGDTKGWYVLFNQLEAQHGDGEDTLFWNARASYGGDIHKLAIKTEGEASLDGEGVEDAEVQLLYSRAVAPFWDIQAGVRYDLEPEGLAHGVVAVQGLAPYWFEIDAAAFLSDDGDVTARIEAEYELYLSQRLILQPRLEANLSAQDIPEREVGSGLSTVDAGLRLRYEVIREFAPYVGVEWQRSFGDTRDFARAAVGDGERTAVMVGIRAWY